MAAKNKKAGRDAEEVIVQWWARVLSLVPMIKSDKGVNDYQVARAEEVSQILDNRGIDIYFKLSLPDWITRLKVQRKRTLCSGKKSKSINVQPLFDMDIEEGDMPILMVDMRIRNKKNQTKYGEVVVLKQADFEELINIYKTHHEEYSRPVL